MTHSLTPRSCHSCGRRGCHGAGCEKATEHLASLSAGQVGWCPESASRPAVWARTHARGASLRQLQVHDDAQNGHSRVPPDYHWAAWMSAHSGSGATATRQSAALRGQAGRFRTVPVSACGSDPRPLSTLLPGQAG